MHTVISNNKRKVKIAKQYAELTLDDVRPPQPGEDDYIDQENGQCCCGEYDCPDSYSHWTRGW